VSATDWSPNALRMEVDGSGGERSVHQSCPCPKLLYRDECSDPNGMSFWSAVRKRDNPPQRRTATIPDMSYLERMSFSVVLEPHCAAEPKNSCPSGGSRS
jgi:hypothetical protein